MTRDVGNDKSFSAGPPFGISNSKSQIRTANHGSEFFGRVSVFTSCQLIRVVQIPSAAATRDQPPSPFSSRNSLETIGAGSVGAKARFSSIRGLQGNFLRDSAWYRRPVGAMAWT